MQRIIGYRRLLETRPEWLRQTTMLQIAAVSRKDVIRLQGRSAPPSTAKRWQR